MTDDHLGAILKNKMEKQSNTTASSLAYVFYCTKYWRARRDHPSMSDITQAELDAMTIYDILTDGLGLLPSNVIMIADPSHGEVLAIYNTMKERFK